MINKWTRDRCRGTPPGPRASPRRSCSRPTAGARTSPWASSICAVRWRWTRSRVVLCACPARWLRVWVRRCCRRASWPRRGRQCRLEWSRSTLRAQPRPQTSSRGRPSGESTASARRCPPLATLSGIWCPRSWTPRWCRAGARPSGLAGREPCPRPGPPVSAGWNVWCEIYFLWLRYECDIYEVAYAWEGPSSFLIRSIIIVDGPHIYIYIYI